MVKALVCGTRDCGFKSHQPPMLKLKNKLKNGGVTVTRQLVEGVVAVLESFDRLPENPDRGYLREMVKMQIETQGFLNLVVFVCPDTNQFALSTATPERFFPERSSTSDLFQPRILKIKELRRMLFEKVGVVTWLNFILGDNGADLYLLPFLKRLAMDWEEYGYRRKKYYRSFCTRVGVEFGIMTEVWSLADLNMRFFEGEVEFSLEELEQERLKRAGDYQETFSAFEVSAESQRRMVRLKRLAYLAQGQFIEEMGGVFLQTEMPWLFKTLMLRSSNREQPIRALPTIYPWIRREELKEIKKGG